MFILNSRLKKSRIVPASRLVYRIRHFEPIRINRLDLIAKPYPHHAWRASRKLAKPLEGSSKTLLSSSEDVPTDERAAKFEECFVNV
ncbi:hypothetical protein, partial [Burkholderia gladioli]|uniref:hypothetical protein n=1 Tax=Burkholderia gladioli TaxID=28095 RepID=UPI001ABB9989